MPYLTKQNGLDYYPNLLTNFFIFVEPLHMLIETPVTESPF